MVPINLKVPTKCFLCLNCFLKLHGCSQNVCKRSHARIARKSMYTFASVYTVYTVCTLLACSQMLTKPINTTTDLIKWNSNSPSEHVNSQIWPVFTCGGNEPDVTSPGCAGVCVLHDCAGIGIPIEFLKDYYVYKRIFKVNYIKTSECKRTFSNTKKDLNVLSFYILCFHIRE